MERYFQDKESNIKLKEHKIKLLTPVSSSSNPYFPSPRNSTLLVSSVCLRSWARKYKLNTYVRVIKLNDKNLQKN